MVLVKWQFSCSKNCLMMSSLVPSPADLPFQIYSTEFWVDIQSVVTMFDLAWWISQGFLCFSFSKNLFHLICLCLLFCEFFMSPSRNGTAGIRFVCSGSFLCSQVIKLILSPSFSATCCDKSNKYHMTNMVVPTLVFVVGLIYHRLWAKYCQILRLYLAALADLYSINLNMIKTLLILSRFRCCAFFFFCYSSDLMWKIMIPIFVDLVVCHLCSRVDVITYKWSNSFYSATLQHYVTMMSNGFIIHWFTIPINGI